MPTQIIFKSRVEPYMLFGSLVERKQNIDQTEMQQIHYHVEKVRSEFKQNSLFNTKITQRANIRYCRYAEILFKSLNPFLYLLCRVFSQQQLSGFYANLYQLLLIKSFRGFYTFRYFVLHRISFSPLGSQTQQRLLKMGVSSSSSSGSIYCRYQTDLVLMV